MENIRTIAFLRALQLGDFLCTIPALRALRKHFPKADISWIGLAHTAHLGKRFNHYIDHFIPFPGYPGLPEQAIVPSAIIAFIEQMQSRRFDLVLQMQGNGTHVNDLVSLFDAKYLGGFYKEGNFRPNTHHFLPYPENLHEVNRHIALMNHLGIACHDSTLEFPIVLETPQLLAHYHLISKRYVCIHPGSRGNWRQWPPEYFARIADYCYQEGFQVVLTGTSAENEIVETVKRHMQAPAISLVGKTSLDELAFLLREAKGLIANCTGVAHIAYALHVPTVTMSMDGEPHRWGPPKNVLHQHQLINWLETPHYNSVKQAVQYLVTDRWPSNNSFTATTIS